MKLCDNPIVLLDADIPGYSYACVCEKKSKLILESGKTEDFVFYYPQSTAYNLIDKLLGYIAEQLSPNYIAPILSPQTKDNNYRFKVENTQKKYKGNRGERPFYYNHVRSYFINTYNASVCEYDEADDQIGKIIYRDYIEAEKTGRDLHYIASTTDKDFRQLPGYLHNFKTGEITYSNHFGYITCEKVKGGYVLNGRGFLYFCAQMLMGDTADNIPGVPRFGPKHSYDILKHCKEYSGAWDVVVKVYLEKGLSRDVVKANASLLWITHEEGRRLPHSHLIEDLL